LSGAASQLGSLFVQDNLRVNRQLTLSFGVRWDPFVPYGDELGRTECFLAGQQSKRFPMVDSAPFSPQIFTPDRKPARMMSYNLTGFNSGINAARVFPGGSGIDAALLRPFEDFGQITQDVSGANSNYNSLQVNGSPAALLWERIILTAAASIGTPS
jgi:hypothetical protein